MDKATIKLVLSAYRTDLQDRDDPLFAEALREVAGDPELAKWFADGQRFDALVRDALAQTPTPAGLKDLILLDAKSPRGLPFLLTGTGRARSGWRRQTGKWLTVAACLVATFILGRQTRPRVTQAVTSSRAASAVDDLGLQAIAYTSKMPALQFVCFSSRAVANWVDEKSEAMHMGKLIDKPLKTMQMIGSSAAEWEGKPVIMIALQNGDRMAMLYLMRAADFPGNFDEAGHVMEKDGWVSKTARNGERVYVLTTKGTRENLNFPMPL